MSLTRELIDQEYLMVQGGERGVIHLAAVEPLHTENVKTKGVMVDSA